MDKTLRVSEAAWQRAKVAAAEQGVSLKDYLEAALASWLRRHEREKAKAAEMTPVEFVTTGGATDGSR